MKQILKAIGFGIILGTAAFFIPFIFKFIFTLMVVALVFKMMFGARKRRRFERWNGKFNDSFAPIVPIDNQWYKATIDRKSSVQEININY